LKPSPSPFGESQSKVAARARQLYCQAYSEMLKSRGSDAEKPLQQPHPSPPQKGREMVLSG
ncbi:hypothetical protein HMPREF3034_00970, partial [Prevotella sp. DNF00663]|uniref:hypothetical protein n=1 Tax=Prevotella sp. DNF00663 TaxID=1384078 RepID=UPI00079C9147